MNIDIRTSTAAVPQDTKVTTDNITKVDHTDENNIQDQIGSSSNEKVARFYSNKDQEIVIENVNPTRLSKSKEDYEFIGLNKEELKSYINNRYWKRIRYTIPIGYIILLLILLTGSAISVLLSPRCPHKTRLNWYEKDLIYEIDLKLFRDSNEDGIGDLQGLQEKMNYLENNLIKIILLRSTIFNSTDLVYLNENILNQTHLQQFIKFVHRKDMHLIIDLPLSSTIDQTNNPCNDNKSNIACLYYKEYGRLPLDFSQKQIIQQAEEKLYYWLSSQKLDGVRIDLPIQLDQQTGLYSISYQTINRFDDILNIIHKKSKTKLILFDIPFGLNHLIIENEIHKKISHPIIIKPSFIDAKQLNQRIQSFKFNHLSLPKFWQLGSLRTNEEIENNLSKEMILTMGMLLGGTPIIIYGDELGIEQKPNRLMLWTPEKPSGGFSSCLTSECRHLFSSFNLDFSKTNVKRQEAIGGKEKDSLLNYFRYLSKLRQLDSFQFGLLETGYDEELNLFWFIRESPGHRGFIIVFNLNEKEKEMSHISLAQLTNNLVNQHIHCEYQSPKLYYSTSNKTLINSDNLFIHSQSINIFSWTPKLIKPNTLFNKAKNYLAN